MKVQNRRSIFDSMIEQIYAKLGATTFEDILKFKNRPIMQKQSAVPTTNAQYAGHLLSTLNAFKATDAPAAVLELVDVQKRFQNFQALSHINLTLKAGEFISFLGPSGCGKTTLLRIIAGLEHPDFGQVLKKGQDISMLSVEKRRCGIVFQNYALFPNLSVAENIAFGLDKKKWSLAERQQRVTELLALIELPNIAEKFPNQLSGGQQQRVALARAIAAKPDLLLLDEPLSALDAQVRLNLRQKIRAIQTQLNLPTIMVTHDQEEALSISDRVVVMNHGVIEQVDHPHNIYHKPQSKFVAQFIGSMNFLTAEATDAVNIRLMQQIDVQLAHYKFKAGQSYSIGFRPEAATLAAEFSQQPKRINLPVAIESIEFLGAKRRLFCRLLLDQSTQTAQATDSAAQDSRLIQIEIDHQQLPQIAEQMYLQVNSDMLHVFDHNGRTLC